jgi:hypothetical protein
MCGIVEPKQTFVVALEKAFFDGFSNQNYLFWPVA